MPKPIYLYIRQGRSQPTANESRAVQTNSNMFYHLTVSWSLILSCAMSYYPLLPRVDAKCITNNLHNLAFHCSTNLSKIQDHLLAFIHKVRIHSSSKHSLPN